MVWQHLVGDYTHWVLFSLHVVGSLISGVRNNKVSIIIYMCIDLSGY